MVYRATYTVSDHFDSNKSSNYDENFSIEVLDCGNSNQVNLSAPTIWITYYDRTGAVPTPWITD
jgi:hypothetical protein